MARTEPISEDELVGMEGTIFTDLVRLSRKVDEPGTRRQLDAEELTMLTRERGLDPESYPEQITLVRNSLEVIMGRLSELRV